MILNHRTVFVLGAGASHAYGFPLGEGLITAVVNDLGSPTTPSFIDRLNQIVVGRSQSIGTGNKKESA